MKRVEVNHISKSYARHNSKGQEVWALSDISFQVNAGESIGIYGGNGSGKSTLLGLLAGNIKPTKGRGEINGKVAPLLGIGTGFHPDLSGKENYYLKGQLQGISKKALTGHFDEMVDFSGLSDFIMEPVKSYSSGMFMRLAFSTAIFTSADIYLIDEVLSVGDFDFRQKCYRKIEALKTNGATILIVSHNLHELQAICDRFLIIDKGHLIEDTNDQQALIRFAYRDCFSTTAQTEINTPFQHEPIMLKSLLINGANANDAIGEDEAITLHIVLKLQGPVCEQLTFMLIIRHQMEAPVFSINTLDNPEFNQYLSNKSTEEIHLTATLPPGLIKGGMYSTNLFVQSRHHTSKIENAGYFLIRKAPNGVHHQKNINLEARFEITAISQSDINTLSNA
jgi:lipopolysaccharide transport system ATP-binding protein